MKLFAAFLLVGAIEVAAGDTTSTTASAAAGAGDNELSAKVRAHLSKLTTLSDGSPNARVTCTAGIEEAGKKFIQPIFVLCSCSYSPRTSLIPIHIIIFCVCTNIIHSRLHRRRDETGWPLAAR